MLKISKEKAYQISLRTNRTWNGAWEVLGAWPTWTGVWIAGCQEGEWVGTGWVEAWTEAWEVGIWPAREDLMLGAEVPAEASQPELLRQGLVTTALIVTGMGTGLLTATSCPLIGQEIGVLTGLKQLWGWAATLMDLQPETLMVPLVMEGGTEA